MGERITRRALKRILKSFEPFPHLSAAGILLGPVIRIAVRVSNFNISGDEYLLGCVMLWLGFSIIVYQVATYSATILKRVVDEEE